MEKIEEEKEGIGQKEKYIEKPFPVLDEAVCGISEQIEVEGIRNFLSLKNGEGGMELEDLFELTPCNKWICVKCAHLEFAPTDEPHDKMECPACNRQNGFMQAAVPLEWLWPKLYLPKPCGLFDIYEEMYSFLKQHIVLQDEALYDIIIAWLISSWKTYRLEVAPYFQILGTIETGKTRLLELLNELCYHGIMAVSITPAALSRVINRYGATILIDQAEKSLRLNTESGVSMYGICLSGYRRGVKYTVADQNDQEKVISKNVFGHKAFTSERVFDPALTSRCITIRMHRHEPLSREIDYEWAKLIRTHLLYYRYKYDVWDKGETILKGRVREIYSSLLRIVESGSRDTTIVEDYARQEKIAKDIELQSSDTAIILKVLLDELLHQEGIEDVAEMYLSDITDMTLLEPKSIGWRLKNMGIPRRRGRTGMYIDFSSENIKHIKQLGIEYGFLKEEEKEVQHEL